MKITGIFLFLIMLFGLPAPTWASLGQTTASVIADLRHMSGELRSTIRAGYTMHEITSANGARVREYVSPNGVVFGVSWSGPFMPDLSQLLGSYFSEFQQAAQFSPGRRRALAIDTGKLVVESAGHMRSFHGRAYVPTLLPQNISAEVVQ